MNDDIHVQRGFADELRALAAEVYDVAFEAKLSLAIPHPPSRIAILKEGFNPEFSFVVVSGGAIVGIAGIKTAQGSLTGGMLRELKEELGFWEKVRAVPILALFERKPDAGELIIEGLAVSPQMRGRGIGTELLHHMIGYAKNAGYASVSLEVIDTNPAARRLYERVGFVPVKTRRFAYLKWLLGFGAATLMEFNLNPDASQPVAADGVAHRR